MADLESTECIGALHVLYSMTLTPVGQLNEELHTLHHYDVIGNVLLFHM